MKYWLSPKIKWKTYKKIMEAISMKDGGPEPEGMEKTTWNMLRKGMLNIYITDEDKEDNVFFTVHNPKKGEMIISDK